MDLTNLLNNKKVLYAEDEEGIRANVSDILELFFDKTITVKDGKEALEAYELEQPDILIIDICMPRVDGLEVIKEIRKSNKKIPIVVLSAHRDEKYLWRAIEQKITKYLIKPFDKHMLLEALNICAMELVDYEYNIEVKENAFYNAYEKIYSKGEYSIQLTKNESRLLEYFISRTNQTVTFDEIANHLWGYEERGKEAIKSLIKDLRKKTDKEIIRNIYGLGYIFDSKN
jgi:DNA-binding response OmpR family regulator